ncbi:hypothetical protein NDU88_003273 [Pleurodeles waltl]|uniref:Uncharacterized protein n=1 Tax=Pleurodeles waltl TaxID=8319 RepID=A0AAV7UYH7_PLEWA|nr:hypothetical protein NDU88_003273 [Pleurodeles waltl]
MGTIDKNSVQIMPTSAEAEPSAPTLQDVLQAIAASREALEVKIDILSIDLGLLRSDNRLLSESVTATEREISKAIPTVAAVGGQMNSVQSQLLALESRSEDAENRARSNNFRVVGLPKTIEGSNKMRYFEESIKKEVAPDGIALFFSLEQAHRVPAQQHPLGAPETCGGKVTAL